VYGDNQSLSQHINTSPAALKRAAAASLFALTALAGGRYNPRPLETTGKQNHAQEIRSR
jgi:hypothetical protein